MRLYCLLLFSSFFLTKPIQLDKGLLQLNIQNVEEKKGIIWVGIYDSEANFMVKEKAIVIGVPPEKSSIEIPDLAFGNYAVALFHDLNHNGNLDLNLVGIPSEPFGFSKKPSSNWRVPKFNEIKFNFTKNKQEINISLAKWTPF